MFDIGGWEFLLIAVIGIIIIGPKELPSAIRNITQWIRKARSLARDFQGGLDEMVREAELDEVRKELEADIDTISVENQIGEAVDPTGDIRGAFDEQDDWYSDHAEEPEPDDGADQDWPDPDGDSGDDDAVGEDDSLVPVDEDDGDAEVADENPDRAGS